jgi:predicted glutamine amidotransferase
MLAKLTTVEEPPTFELLSAPNSLKEQAYCANLINGEKGPHNDGCGVAWLEGETIRR